MLSSVGPAYALPVKCPDCARYITTVNKSCTAATTWYRAASTKNLARAGIIATGYSAFGSTW